MRGCASLPEPETPAKPKRTRSPAKPAEPTTTTGTDAPTEPVAAPAEKAERAPPKPKAAPTTPRAPRATAPPKATSTSAHEDFPKSATFVDASGLVLGRAASLIAKRLLQGETVVVVNAEKSVVIGNRHMVIDEFVEARARGSVRSGPHYPRYPDRIFRRTVRGMLPHLKTRGKIAFHRLHVYIGVPDGLSGRAMTALDGARARPALRSPTTLGEITRLLGARL